MKIEKKESNGLVTFGSLKWGDVFEWEEGIFIKAVNRYSNSQNATYLEDGDDAVFEDSSLVKPYPNAKLILED